MSGDFERNGWFDEEDAGDFDAEGDSQTIACPECGFPVYDDAEMCPQLWAFYRRGPDSSVGGKTALVFDPRIIGDSGDDHRVIRLILRAVRRSFFFGERDRCSAGFRAAGASFGGDSPLFFAPRISPNIRRGMCLIPLRVLAPEDIVNTGCLGWLENLGRI